MNVPLRITYRGVEKTDAIEALIREKAAKLEQVCDHISSCRVALEMPQRHQKRGNPYRIRIDITVPPGHELVARRETTRGDIHEELSKVIRDTFDSARRQLKELVEKQRGEIKTHTEQEVRAFVSKLFREQGYGFIRTLDGRDIYFHRNAVVNEDFDNLTLGTGVHYLEEEGAEGPQASTIRVFGKPGHRESEKE